MSIKIIKLNLNKNNFFFWVDKEIKLTFEITSEENKVINELSIFYWCNFFCKKQKHVVYENKIQNKDIHINSMKVNCFSYIIPIKYFNYINNNDLSNIKIENYISIQIKKWIIWSTVFKKILPEIFLNTDWINYLNTYSENDNENDIIMPENSYRNKTDILKNIKNKDSDFLIFKKHFRWILKWELHYISESSIFTIDLIHKDIFNKIKGYLVINLFTQLVNSNIYNLIYKYIFILPIIWFLILVLYKYLLIYLSIKLDFLFTVIFFIFPISFIVFSKILEFIFNEKIKNILYNYKIKNTDKIKFNLENKLISGKLNIYDIFENFTLNINHNFDYNFNISLELIIWSYYYRSEHKYHERSKVYSLDLFNYIGKWYINLNDVKLLDNNYNNIKNILLDSNLNEGTEVFYKIKFKFTSLYLPNLYDERKIYLKFK